MDVDIDHAAQEAVLRRVRYSQLVEAATRLNISAQQEVPVDSGNLRRSHEIEGPDTEAREIVLEATAPYSIFVHDGHRIVAWGHDTGRYQQPNPWLRRAIDREAM